MKILRVIASVNPENGGPVESIRQITPALAAQGHTTEVACLDAPDAPWIGDLPCAVHALGPSRSSYCYTPALPVWLAQNASKYDAVLVDGLWQHAGFGTWQALHEKRTPYFVFTHGMLDPWFNRAYPLKRLKKNLYWRWGEYRVLRDARAVLFTCEEERVLAKQSFRPYHCREQVVNFGTAPPSGDADAQRAQFLAQFPPLRGKRLVLFLSRIHVKKGCDLLIRAFAEAARQEPTLRLVMAGPDSMGWQSELERLAQERNVAERITWTGMLSGDLKWGALHSAEVFALPSHQENFGIAVAEALACGIPVLISNKVNIWREIERDGAGLVAEDDAAGTLALLQRWLHLPPQAQRQMRTNARRCFAELFEI